MILVEIVVMMILNQKFAQLCELNIRQVSKSTQLFVEWGGNSLDQ